MSARLPPRLATWLLERLGGSRSEPLIGDLIEQLEGGRSRLWYCREAAGALAIELAQSMRAHALSFIAAIVVGCALIWLWNVGCPYVFQPLYENLPAVSRHPWSARALLRLAGLQFHGLLGNALIFSAVWLVSRIHRAHPRAVLVALVFAMSGPSLPGFARLVIHTAADSPLSTARWIVVLMPVAFPALCTLAAGLWVIRGLRFTELDWLTRVVVVLATSVYLLVGLAHRAQLVGELNYTLQQADVFALLDVGSIAYLAFLLWRPRSADRCSRSGWRSRSMNPISATESPKRSA